MSSPITITQDFRHHVQTATHGLLRQRFLWLIGVLFGAHFLALLLQGLFIGAFSSLISARLAERFVSTARGGRWGLLTCGLIILADFAFVGWFASRAWRKRIPTDRLLQLTYWVFIERGLVYIAMHFLLRDLGFPLMLGVYHVLACLVLPWSPRQALRPMLALLVLNGIAVLSTEHSSLQLAIAAILFSAFLIFPGLGVSWLKTNRHASELKVRFLQDRYGEIRRELVDARRIHESLFPRPVLDGPLRFTYKYEPMRQIGGDYLYARFGPQPLDDADADPFFNVLLIDVTGHGIAAALTVNRLYGEVERVYAEDPFASPADVLCALNSYVNLTLSKHSIYATALCIRVDPRNNRLEYASGGHPPAFLCGADKRIRDLGSTSYVLGAVGPIDFDAAMETLEFAPGDAFIAYTDGAIEARNQEGKQFGIFGLQGALAACVDGPRHEETLTSTLLSFIERHRFGPPEDDTLVVEIRRTLDGVTRGASSDLPSRGRVDAKSKAPGPIPQPATARVTRDTAAAR